MKLPFQFQIVRGKGGQLKVRVRIVIKKKKKLLSKLTRLRKRAKPGTKKFLQHKEAALTRALARIEHFNTHYGFAIKEVRIRNQKTRWGSCSKKGNLNFNYKIALLSERLADYIIVHELCHLGEFNHSKKFWDLVAETVPDHAACRAELRKVRP